MGEVIGAFGGCEAVEQATDRGPQCLASAWCLGSQQSPKLGKDLFDRVEVGEYDGRNHSEAPRASMALGTPATL